MALERAPINRYPGGFLGFMDVKSMGKPPGTIMEEVRPTIDMTMWYLAERLKFTGTLAITPAAPDVYWDAPNVPANKAWLVESAWVESVTAMGAGSAIVCSVAIGKTNLVGGSGSADAMFIGERTAISWTTGDQGVLASAYFQRPFLMLPGWRFGVAVTRMTTPPQLSLRASYVQIDY